MGVINMGMSNKKVYLKPFNEVWCDIPTFEPNEEPFDVKEWVSDIISEAEEWTKKVKKEEVESKHLLEDVRKQTSEMVNNTYSNIWEMITEPSDTLKEIEDAKRWAQKIIQEIEKNS